MRRRLPLLAFVLVAAGCASALRFGPAGEYEVRRGDTLYSIAFRHGLDYRELARWNGIAPPYLIAPGQVLTLAGPGATATAAAPDGTRTASAERAPPAVAAPSGPVAPLRWARPVTGRVLAGFRAGGSATKGIDFDGRRGDAILAAADGRVVYAGSGLAGYGKVIIVKHDERWLSAYAHLDEFVAQEGEHVQRGQRIAAMGLGPGQRPMLHFEIRLDGRPVDPVRLLPAP